VGEVLVGRFALFTCNRYDVVPNQSSDAIDKCAFRLTLYSHHRRLPIAEMSQTMQSRVTRPAWQGPSNITTFVRCLRLLDLDQLSDWPDITENVFTSKAAQQNLQGRIKAVEWGLYRLFELYDPKETYTVGCYKLLRDVVY
jgi:hypothetical protein